MGSFGGMRPYPRKFGGGKSNEEVILNSLNADLGTAYEADDETKIVYVQNLAIARAIAAGWATNGRLGLLWDPRRMSMDIVARWENILAITPSPTATDNYRRTQLSRLMARFGQPAIYGILADALRSACGDAFVAIEHTDVASATITVPDGTYPFGTVVSGKPWSSTVAHIKVQLTKPSGWTEGQFREAAKQVSLVLDPELPAWCTYEWYRVGMPLGISAITTANATVSSAGTVKVVGALAKTLSAATVSSTATKS